MPHTIEDVPQSDPANQAVDEFTFTTDQPELGDIGQLIRSRGLIPEEWVVISTTLNTWQAQTKDGEVLDLQQWKVSLRRAPHLVLPQPAVHVPRVKARPLTPSASRPQLIAVFSDHQAPYHDPELHAASLEALRHFRKRNLVEVVHLGDLIDLPTLSKHPDKPGEAGVQACIQSGYEILRDLAEVGGMPIKYIPGNHEFRLQQYMYDRARELYGVTPADDDCPALSLRALLHLDRLNIELVESPLGWQHSEVEITPDSLVARHGWLTSANSAEKSLLKRGRSIIFGHLHRRQTVYQWDASAGLERQAHCLGTMSRTRDARYPSYVTCEDWTPGFATVTWFPDGQWTVDHAIWANGVLRWRDKQWTP